MVAMNEPVLWSYSIIQNHIITRLNIDKLGCCKAVDTKVILLRKIIYLGNHTKSSISVGGGGWGEIYFCRMGVVWEKFNLLAGWSV